MKITIKRGEYIKEIEVEDGTQVSDGYHTFDELYEHRFALWIALCRTLQKGYDCTWRSKLHSDGTSYEGWFVLGCFFVPGSQMTYHLPLSRWEDCDFAPIVDRAYFDGHTSADVLERLKRL